MWNKILQDLARQSERSGKLPEATPRLLRQIWPTLVGEKVARYSTPVKLVGSTLHIDARHTTLVREWKSRPMPLLRRIRQFSPWSVETLEIRHNPDAGAKPDDIPSDLFDEVAAEVEDPPVEGPTLEGADPGLQALIDSISRHRRRGDDNS